VSVVLRRVTRADADAAATLWQRATDARRDALDLAPITHEASVLDREGVFGVGLFDDDVVVSMAIAMPARGDNGRSVHNVPGLAHISSVATLPSHWGQGYAGRVVEAVMSLARRRGYARVQLWTHATNVGALKLYHRCGFSRSGRTNLDPHDEPIVHLVRELPVVEPVNRPAARLLCLDPLDRILLMHWRDPDDGHQVWEPPGGGIESGEDPSEAVLREWREETGLPVPAITSPPTPVSRDTFWGGGRIVADELFYLGRLDAALDVVPSALTEVEAVSLLGWGWVRVTDLDALDDPVEPDLIPILDRFGGEDLHR
jgi:8-oxo-dGTP pyrophosphatase MutT (NUDIX family)/ribosomal protein S18 acetylase RimI-like enzyme